MQIPQSPEKGYRESTAAARVSDDVIRQITYCTKSCCAIPIYTSTFTTFPGGRGEDLIKSYAYCDRDTFFPPDPPPIPSLGW